MKVKALPVFLLLFFCSTFVFAQIQNEEGTILLKDGAVLKGNITYFYNDPSDDILITDSTAATINAKPEQVQEIVLVSGKKFVSMKFKGKEDTRSLILQVLIGSPGISLYTRKEWDKKHFYVSKNDILFQLEKIETLLTTDTGSFTKVDRKYIATLHYLMSDRPDLSKSLNKLELSEEDLVKIITAYNKGSVTYYWKTNIKTVREPNWMLFGQFSNYAYAWSGKTAGASYGMAMGLQYHFSHQSHHSFKYAADWSNYNYIETTEYTKINYYVNYKAYSLELSYQYDLVRANKYSLYLLVHVADVTYRTKTDDWHGTKEKSLVLVPRFNPGLGLEVRPWKRVALYAELNSVLFIDYFPKCNSFGFKYDFGKIYW